MLYHRYKKNRTWHGRLMKRIPEDLFVKLMTKKANIIKDHLKNSLNQLIIVANIGSTMATFQIL